MTLYAQRDTEALGEHYFRHVEAMTGEQLYDKSAIAAELAWRDAQIERLANALTTVGHTVDRIATESSAIPFFLPLLEFIEQTMQGKTEPAVPAAEGERDA